MSYRSEPVSMWFDRRLVMRPSPIHGTGTFATDDILQGETLIYVTGGLVYTAADRKAEAIKLAGAMYNEEQIENDVVILTPKVFNYYINHSCDPNAVDLSRHPTWTHYVAMRHVRANEEITADYYDPTTLPACACGSPGCRWRNTTQ